MKYLVTRREAQNTGIDPIGKNGDIANAKNDVNHFKTQPSWDLNGFRRLWKSDKSNFSHLLF